MMTKEWALDGWLKPEVLTGAYAVLKILFWMLAGLFMVAVMKHALIGKAHKTIGRAYRIFFVWIAVLFGGILIYQSTWQLAGFARPDFVEFMKRYDRRPDNPVSKMVRGRVLDARGRILAVSSEDRTAQRRYPLGAIFCHVLGYEHRFFGLSGLEASEHAMLSGYTRETGPEWEQFRRNLVQRTDLRGSDLTLTLWADLQEEAHAAMHGRKGAVVFLDPSNGALLVLYSSPGYDPNQLDASLFEGKDTDAHLLNRALRGLYPAGSTFKMLVAATALEQHIQPVLDCPAEGFQAGTGNRPIRDHEYYEHQRQGRKWPGQGRLSLKQAFIKSSNVYFAQLGVQLGGEALHATALRCGLTRAWVVHEGSSSPMAGVAGQFPALTSKDQARTAQVSIGQGEMLVTPLHMALIAGAVGRNGIAWKPRLSVATPPEALPPFFASQSANVLADMMRQAVENGTGRGADLPGLHVAGKTGTAQNPHGADHSWFVGFAPAHQPRVAFAVIVEQGGYGSQAALPVAVAVLRKAEADGLLAPQAASTGAR